MATTTSSSQRFNNAKILANDLEQVKRAKRSWFHEAETDAIKFYRKSFDNQGWEGRRWPARQRQRAWPILVKTGALKNSIRVLGRGENWFMVGSDLDYAIVHNDGLGHQRKRQFMGDSDRLTKILLDKLDSLLKQIFTRNGN